MGLTLSYNPDIPQADNNPSVSQGEMLTNFSSIGAATNSWTTQDHYGFGTGFDGQHKNLNFPENNALLSQTGLASGVNTAPGTANNAASQLNFTNAQSTFPLSGVRAFGKINGSNGALLNGTNATTARGGSGVYTATLINSCVTGTDYVVICSTSRAAGGTDQMEITYTISGNVVTFVTVQQINPVSAVDVVSMSFVILQI